MIVCILTAFAIFGVLASIERSFNAGQDVAAADRLVVVNKINFTPPLPVAYFNRVRATEGVQQVTHLNWFGGYYQDPKNFLIVMAVDPVTYIGCLWQRGRYFIRGAADLHSRTHWRARWRSHGKKMGLSVLRTAAPALNGRVAKTIDQIFANSSYETATDTEKAFNKAFVAQFGNIALIVILVVGAAFVTILMIVGNTLMMSVRERTREIGVFKALGFSGGRIVRLVLGESIVLALAGGLSGLGWAALFIIAVRDSVRGLLPQITVSLDIALAGLALMLVFGVVTGLIPALNAMRLRIAAALGRN
jgi:ABC-type antimicrobial peptide transport system permease subunit